MRKSILAVVMTAAASLIAGAANAQTATQDITINATVPKLCTVNLAANGAVDTATIVITAAANVDTTPVTPSNAPYTNVACNAPANLQLTSQGGGLTGPGSVPGFDNIINYTGSATWNSVTATVNTATVATAAGAEAGTAQLVGANTGSLSVTITPGANAQPLVMGNYSDTLRVTLTPQ